jgi:acetyl/propionyl-CoA carboxylase alpha subunit
VEIKTNSGRTIQFAEREGKWYINSEEVPVDLLEHGQGSFHMLVSGKGYEVNLLKSPADGHGYFIRVNGKEFEVSVKSKTELLLEKMGMKKEGGSKQQELKAPMPGLISSVLVKEGQKVQKGDPLLILEAMKMENVLKSLRDGEIKQIKIKEKQSVEKNDLLLTFV